ncbi:MULTISPECIES: hypothetical protein [Streptomyces]|uniref:hypothetical protein n=1 Tax=Streptomyces TaxID=1883 RepID=UPI001F0FDAE0|nr:MULTISPECIES: hypothetical protein [Streptomyces]
MEDERQQDDVPAVRDALMTPRRLSRLLFGPEAETQLPTSTPVAVRVEQAWNDYQGGRLGSVIAALPALLQTAQELEDRAARRGDDRSDCWAVIHRRYAGVIDDSETENNKKIEKAMGWGNVLGKGA